MCKYSYRYVPDGRGEISFRSCDDVILKRETVLTNYIRAPMTFGTSTSKYRRKRIYYTSIYIYIYIYRRTYLVFGIIKN